ncbi:MAG: LacI family DNA-binding transcriptional regulator [Anaerolineae bacterium]|nr:LacI family DNA-binding transcriptional regulator [Anaerolineae bacterium]
MASSKSSRPTMIDVAKLSGVSYQTVSRVINNHPYVSKEVRLRVKVAIDTLGYRPSKAATKLASKSSKIIATVLYGSWFPGLAEIALNVELAAKTSGFDVILINITEPQKQLVEALENVKAWAVDGIILIVPVQGLSLEEIQESCEKTPFVFIDAHQTMDTPSVVIDEAYGTQELVEHLIHQGHTQFGEISGPLDWLNAQVRHQTCIQTFEAHGMEPPVHVEANWTVSGGYRAAKRLLADRHTLTAIIAANDSMALGVMRALHEAGLTVPQDVSVVGFDDIPEAAYLTPPLTTVRRNLIQLGMTGFEYLMQRMDDLDAVPQQQTILPRVIFRASTRPVRPA